MSRCSRPDCYWRARSIRPICIASSRAGPAPGGSTSFGVDCTRWRRPGESRRRIPFSWRIGWPPARTSAVCRHWPSRTRSRNTSQRSPVSRPAGRTSAARRSAGSRSVTSSLACFSAVVRSTSDRASTPSSRRPKKHCWTWSTCTPAATTKRTSGNCGSTSTRCSSTSWTPSPKRARCRSSRGPPNAFAGSPGSCRRKPTKSTCGFGNAALRQTEWRGPEMTPRAWRPAVVERLEALDWDLAASDVRPFLERDEDAALVTKGNALGLLAPRSPPRT